MDNIVKKDIRKTFSYIRRVIATYNKESLEMVQRIMDIDKIANFFRSFYFVKPVEHIVYQERCVIMKNFEVDLDSVLDNIKILLLEKNTSYGNSALEPINAFSKASSAESIRIRIDDKINRMIRGNMEVENEKDTIIRFNGLFSPIIYC